VLVKGVKSALGSLSGELDLEFLKKPEIDELLRLGVLRRPKLL